MVQALIAESLLPIARTGRFATLDPVEFLEAIGDEAGSALEDDENNDMQSEDTQ